MARYAGLTDDLNRRFYEHGCPSDWQVFQFYSESQARAWEQQMHTNGYAGSGGGAGWRFGYVYTITPYTRE